MTYQPHGKHLIAGQRIAGEARFFSAPAQGEPQPFSAGRPGHIAAAAEAAEEAFWSFSAASRASRAAFLNAIADEIEARGADITAIGSAETGLPEARLEGERGRTAGQLRLFAGHILDGSYLDRRRDAALPDRQPLPRPDLRMMQVPLGPVAVFGASNFPLAFSVAGGDTASALAAGCPVVVKGHEAHPGTSEIVAEAICAAVRSCGLHPGVFSLVQGGSRETGAALVQHPLIKAAGFTGSLAGGRALAGLCAARPEPIPFFGELGSVNPVFILPGALAARGAGIAEGWAASLTMGAGQFCTNPGVIVLHAGAAAEDFIRTAAAALAAAAPQTMLTDGIAAACRAGRDRLAALGGVCAVLETDSSGRSALPAVCRTTAETWLAQPALGAEVFGPFGMIVTCGSAQEMREVALGLEGQLTCTLQLDDSDQAAAADLLPVLTRKAGRVLANGFPTGVEVSSAMVHGGPFPASTNAAATSVGTLAVRRFLRPVCYQNMPAALLPEDLQI